MVVDLGLAQKEVGLGRRKKGAAATAPAPVPWVIRVETFAVGVTHTQQEIALPQTVEERPTVGDVLSGLVAVSRRRPQEVPFLALLHDGIPVVSRDLSVQVQGGDTLTCIL